MTGAAIGSATRLGAGTPHYSHNSPHCGRTRTLLTTVCSRQGASAATADGENYMHGRKPASSACTVAEDAAGDWLPYHTQCTHSALSALMQASTQFRVL